MSDLPTCWTPHPGSKIPMIARLECELEAGHAGDHLAHTDVSDTLISIGVVPKPVTWFNFLPMGFGVGYKNPVVDGRPMFQPPLQAAVDDAEQTGWRSDRCGATSSKGECCREIGHTDTAWRQDIHVTYDSDHYADWPVGWKQTACPTCGHAPE